MSRLSYRYYLQYHLLLRQAWLRGAHAFVVLTPAEQIALHTFYEPALDLSEDELRAHRARVTLADPSLPQRAGKAYAKIAPYLGTKPPAMLGGTSAVIAGKRKGEYRRITLWGEVKPKIEPADLAKILAELFKEDLRLLQEERERAREQDDDDRAA